jgi:glycosyltransferase involved in cell wall biosynthesis
MHRHLTALGEAYDITSAHLEEGGHLSLSRRYVRWQTSRFRRWSETLNAIFPFAVPARQLRPLVAQADLVLVVAESPTFAPALAEARRQRVPVVAIVHDWSSVWLNVPQRLRSLADTRFLAACRQCTFTLSVSQALVDALGGGPRHRLLYPIPEAAPAVPPAAPSAAFHAIYAGVFHYFHAGEISGLCEELLRRNRPDLLRLYGPPPDWSAAYAQPVRRGHFHAGFAPRAELPGRLAAAGALLVVCPFATQLAPFSQYSFPSKLTEYCRFGRPIILWGPEYAAAVRWARESRAVLVVTDPNPSAVADALQELERQPDLAAQLGLAARAAAATTFAPERLQAIFEATLRDALPAPR